MVFYKKYILLFFISICSIVSAMAQLEIKVMSYNIRLDTKSDGINQWENRKEQVAGLIRYYAPDFFGGQEVMHHQLQYLLKELPGYAHVGVARDDGKQEGEYSPILYNAQKFRFISGGTFWLSPTPDSVSFGWDAVCRRVCSYGIFEDTLLKQKVFLLNTHFDHVGEIARAASAKLILMKLKELNTQNYPVLLTGDFNATEEKEPIQFLEEKLSNARSVSISTPYGPEDTWNGFRFDTIPSGCIDYILVDKRKLVQVTKFITLTQSYDLKYPSDHFPIMATIQISKP